MKVKAKAFFIDKVSGTKRKPNDEFEVTKDRFKEIERFVVEIKEPKKPKENVEQ